MTVRQFGLKISSDSQLGDLGTDKGKQGSGEKEELVRNHRRPERRNQEQPLKLMQGKSKT